MQGTDLQYQWFKDGGPLPGPNARRAILSIGGAATSDCGVYHATVTNAGGTATSAKAVVHVQPPPEPALASAQSAVPHGVRPRRAGRHRRGRSMSSSAATDSVPWEGRSNSEAAAAHREAGASPSALTVATDSHTQAAPMGMETVAEELDGEKEQRAMPESSTRDDGVADLAAGQGA